MPLDSGITEVPPVFRMYCRGSYPAMRSAISRPGGDDTGEVSGKVAVVEAASRVPDERCIHRAGGLKTGTQQIDQLLRGFLPDKMRLLIRPAAGTIRVSATSYIIEIDIFPKLLRTQVTEELFLPCLISADRSPAPRRIYRS